MILKAKIKDGWKLYDNIERVEIRYGCRKLDDTPQIEFETPSKDIFTVDEICSDPYFGCPDYTVVSMCKFKECNWVIIAINAKGYIMNDNGETIETI